MTDKKPKPGPYLIVSYGAPLLLCDTIGKAVQFLNKEKPFRWYLWERNPDGTFDKLRSGMSMDLPTTVAKVTG